MSDPILVDALLQEGITAVKAGQKAEARQKLMQVVELDERNEQGWLWLSGVVETLEDRRVCLENVLAINPNNAHARSGLQWLNENAPPSAPASGTTATQDRCPRCEAQVPPSGADCPNCKLPLIVACPSCGQYVDVQETACPYCRNTLGDYRTGARYHLALAQAYLERGKVDPAQQAIVRVEAESPNDPAVLVGLANLYERIGRADQAVDALKRAVERSPDDASLYTRLGALYNQRGKSDDARAMYQMAAQLGGDDPDVLFDLAKQQMTVDSTSPVVIQFLDRVIEKKPMFADAYLLKGDAFLSQQNQDQARIQYEHAAKLASGDTKVGQEARNRIVQLQIASGEYARNRQGRSGLPGSRASRQRPGCITVYAVLLGMGGVLGILGTLCGAVALSANRDVLEQVFMAEGVYMPGFDLSMLMGAVWIYVIVALVGAAINITLAIGLWNMKNWARIVVLIMQGIGLLITLCQAIVSIASFSAASEATGAQGAPGILVCSFIPGFLIGGYIIFWFWANRELFD